MYIKGTLFILMSAWLVSGQRPSFAGTKPIGFPILTNKTPSNELGNRFGDDGKKQELPIEAQGNWEVIERISKLPVDQQPFWYLNWKALEENRKNPQTYQQNPNSFAPSTSNSGSGFNTASNSNTGLNSKFGETDSANTFSDPNGQTQNYNYNYRNYRQSRRY